MKYTDRNFLKLKTGMKVWVCAYKCDDNRITMKLMQPPTYGMLRGFDWDYKNDVTKEKGGHSSFFFAPFKKGSETEFIESESVASIYRVFADTYEECVELFNDMVRERANWFKQRAIEVEKDIIS